MNPWLINQSIWSTGSELYRLIVNWYRLQNSQRKLVWKQDINFQIQKGSNFPQNRHKTAFSFSTGTGRRNSTCPGKQCFAQGKSISTQGHSYTFGEWHTPKNFIHFEESVSGQQKNINWDIHCNWFNVPHLLSWRLCYTWNLLLLEIKGTQQNQKISTWWRIPRPWGKTFRRIFLSFLSCERPHVHHVINIPVRIWAKHAANGNVCGGHCLWIPPRA